MRQFSYYHSKQQRKRAFFTPPYFSSSIHFMKEIIRNFKIQNFRNSYLLNISSSSVYLSYENTKYCIPTNPSSNFRSQLCTCASSHTVFKVMTNPLCFLLHISFGTDFFPSAPSPHPPQAGLVFDAHYFFVLEYTVNLIVNQSGLFDTLLSLYCDTTVISKKGHFPHI